MTWVWWAGPSNKPHTQFAMIYIIKDFPYLRSTIRANLVGIHHLLVFLYFQWATDTARLLNRVHSVGVPIREWSYLWFLQINKIRAKCLSLTGGQGFRALQLVANLYLHKNHYKTLIRTVSVPVLSSHATHSISSLRHKIPNLFFCGVFIFVFINCSTRIFDLDGVKHILETNLIKVQQKLQLTTRWCNVIVHAI